MTKTCLSSNYFLILILLVFFMLLYVYIGPPMTKQLERFNVQKDNELLDKDKIVVLQGLGNPDIPIQATAYDDNDVSSPAVDGSENGPKSKLVFAYNTCKPECCATSGGYSCSGGCPCMTNSQLKFAGSRGGNSRLNNEDY